MVAGILAASLLISSCTKNVAVPDVTLQDLDQAENGLKGVQLTAKVTGLPSGTVTEGAYVASQSPPVGQPVPINSAVDLVVVPGVVLPDLTTSSLTDAVNTLQGLGLRVSLVKEPTNNIFSKGRIKRQTPPGSPTPIRRDATVTLTVESPPNVGSLLGLITQDPSYVKLNPRYRSILDEFLKPADGDAGGTPNPVQHVVPPCGQAQNPASCSPSNPTQQPKTGAERGSITESLGTVA